ncbi:Hypothetical protein A7982_05627 [Minicystis rosea]|nr:Hypothetical protein A7982_05627 [Minicystis rosea]
MRQQRGSCPQPTEVDEYCFDWPLPEDAGTGGEPGACPDPKSAEATNDVTMFGKDANGEGIQEGANVVGAGSTKQGQCCYRASQIFFCE